MHKINSFLFRLLLVLLLSLTLSSNSQAQEYYYTLTPGIAATKQLSHRAGQTVFVSTTYNAGSQRFVWQMSFNPSPSTGWLPNGLYMVINNGFFPKGRQAESAMLFFDATNSATPRLTAYAYNGNNAGDSWKTGDFGGSQPPDKILSSITNTSWINSLRVDDQPGVRTFTIDVSAGIINAHIPLYPSLRWFGLKFDNSIGIWAHPVANMVTEYGNDGFLTRRTGNDGYVDVARDQSTGCDGVKGSDKQVDVCGVCGGNGSSCVPITSITPGPTPTCASGDAGCQSPNEVCRTDNISSSLFALDSRAAELKNLSLLISKKTKYFANGRSSISKKIKANTKRAQALYIDAWTSAWATPTKITSCTGTTSCSNVDITSFKTRYLNAAIAQYKLIIAQINLFKKASSSSTASYRRAQKKRADQIIILIKSEVANLPSASSLCS